MKRKITLLSLVLLSAFTLFFSYMNAPENAYSNTQPCYVCSDKSIVCYSGGDTFAKRKEAKTKFNCAVSTTSTCSPSQCKKNLD